MAQHHPAAGRLLSPDGGGGSCGRWLERPIGFTPARAAGDVVAAVYGFVPQKQAEELKHAIASYYAATTTLQVKGMDAVADGENLKSVGRGVHEDGILGPAVAMERRGRFCGSTWPRPVESSEGGSPGNVPNPERIAGISKVQRGMEDAMSENVNKSEEAFRERVRAMEVAVRAGANSVGLGPEDKDLTVVHYFGSRGQVEGPIRSEWKQTVLAEIVSRADLAGRPKGEMRLSLLGTEYKVVVDKRERFDESSFNLTLKKIGRRGT